VFDCAAKIAVLRSFVKSCDELLSVCCLCAVCVLSVCCLFAVCVLSVCCLFAVCVLSVCCLFAVRCELLC
jgi:hypothetical protein